MFASILCNTCFKSPCNVPGGMNINNVAYFYRTKFGSRTVLPTTATYVEQSIEWLMWPYHRHALCGLVGGDYRSHYWWKRCWRYSHHLMLPYSPAEGPLPPPLSPATSSSSTWDCTRKIILRILGLHEETFLTHTNIDYCCVHRIYVSVKRSYRASAVMSTDIIVYLSQL